MENNDELNKATELIRGYTIGTAEDLKISMEKYWEVVIAGKVTMIVRALDKKAEEAKALADFLCGEKLDREMASRIAHRMIYR